MNLQIGKLYRTRGSRYPARVVDLNYRDYTGALRAIVIISIETSDFTAVYDQEGHRRYVNTPAEWDLLPDESLWINVYSHMSYTSKEAADRGVLPHSKRIACLQFKEGDGL